MFGFIIILMTMESDFIFQFLSVCFYHQGTSSVTAKATTAMNSRTIVHLLFVFSFFATCLPAPRHFLVETEDGEETQGKIEDGGEGAGGDFGLDYADDDDDDDDDDDNDGKKKSTKPYQRRKKFKQVEHKCFALVWEC